MNIFEALRKDHDEQRNLLSKLLETSGDTEERERLYLNIKHKLSSHADAEEKCFYSHLIKKDLTQSMTRHSIAEHKEIDDYIKELDDTDKSSASWLKTAQKLDDRVRHHLEEEEREIFQLAGKVLSDDEKLSLAAQYQKEML